MKNLWSGLLVIASVAAFSQQIAPVPEQSDSVMVVAISRDSSILTGGIGPGQWTGRGTAYAEPIARLTQSGKWIDIPCGIAQEAHKESQRECRKFAREYLSKPQDYTVESTDGHGAMVHAAPSTLDECFEYRGTATYSAAVISNSAIAASFNDFFSDIASPQLIGKTDAVPILKALGAFVPKKLDSLQNLKLSRVNLENQSLVIVQRTYAQRERAKGGDLSKFIFAIGKMETGRFTLLHWKMNTDDEDERIVGTIRLKSGRDFLITSVSDPESQYFRIYGIRDGKLALVYSGGGAAC